MIGSNQPAHMVYFAPALPWQQQSWKHLTARSENKKLPHGLLFSGMQGIGKRAFVWRFVAWLLCDNQAQHPEQACGNCQSCHWLMTSTHPDLRVLPEASMPVSVNEEMASESAQSNKSLKSKRKSGKKVGSSTKKETTVNTSIKVDDIRQLQPFISQGSTGLKICVIDNAESMTIAAANALLKTLEEPSDGVLLFLISDTPTKLLATIKSRVQNVAIDSIQRDKVKGYLANTISSHHLIKKHRHQDMPLDEHINQLLNLANGAPLAALNILTSDWYAHREVWLKTWLALRSGKRSHIAASDYWQKTLILSEFIALSEVMLMDFSRCCLGMEVLQQDLNLIGYASIRELQLMSIQNVMQKIDDIKFACLQNVQDKAAYDRILSELRSL